jgi:hypothetical protein
VKLDGVTPVRSLEQNEKIAIGACAQLLFALILRIQLCMSMLCTHTYIRTYVHGFVGSY